jgi:drug/metabolite transporter (DMT)-like permease
MVIATFTFYKTSANHFDKTFWYAIGWLAIPVSIFTVLLWLWLLQVNAARAGHWLFLCLLFCFVFAAWFIRDAISIYTIAGVVLALGGLLLSKINTRNND